MSDPLSILVVSHTYVTPENRGKLEEMGRRARVRALVPAQGADIAGVQRAAASGGESYELGTRPLVRSPLPGTRWLFRRGGRARGRSDAAVLERAGSTRPMRQG